MQTIQNHQVPAIPPALAAVAQGRDYIKTAEFAHAMSCANQTILKNHCLTGECFGIRPIKHGKFLLWSVTAIAKLLNGEK
ncbi:hypothetical protein [Noviherbaspirillum suwonense]|uniref:DNA-binding protein n=1 Tax=Noviherbaspirillum suwonense TaxID=1224511 RepID=A0ABY1Q4J2_9BURK|nr:hypothetical protein [Noviherbaspirillum suwonense]SMP59403.1 hypothetical protein SAMN06295970_10670 [Noviherbaspirillum suwonense]